MLSQDEKQDRLTWGRSQIPIYALLSLQKKCLSLIDPNSQVILFLTQKLDGPKMNPEAGNIHTSRHTSCILANFGLEVATVLYYLAMQFILKIILTETCTDMAKNQNFMYPFQH